MIPTNIIVHHSLTEDGKTVSWQAIREWHTGVNAHSPYRWRDIGYHFGIELIDKRHEILMGRMIDEPGAHTRGSNHDSLGICFVGNFDKDVPDPKQWSLGVRLVSSLCRTFNIGRHRVYGHNHFADYKSCPGKYFDMDLFRSQLR